MQKALTLLMVSMLLTGGTLRRNPTSGPAAPLTAQAAAKIIFRRDATAFATAAERLRMIVRDRAPGAFDTQKVLAALKDCRMNYKKIESFICWFFPATAAGINGPPVYEGEEPFMEYQEPRGLQLMEALLTAKMRPSSRQRLTEQADLIAETAGALPGLMMYGFSINEADILQSIRLALIRLTTLGITGYDAPELKTGLPESAIVSDGIREQLSFFSGAEGLVRRVQSITTRLKTAQDFNGFDRITFIRAEIIPFQTALAAYCENRGILLPETGLLRAATTNIYAAGAMRPATGYPANHALTDLGKKWFSDKTLSRGNARSCASCHNPARSFTDGLIVSAGLTGKKPLKRNAPTLLYSAYQYRQFWDGKAAGLPAQIFTVLHDPLEMDIDTVNLSRNWKTDPGFREQIGKAFPDPIRLSVSEMIVAAVGAYVTTLGSFNSDFDRYMQGNDTALNEAAKNGFNLFMGKARCGTCHFAPVFNGSLPPAFERTEFEIAGTLQNTDFHHPVQSKDAGRYGVYPLPFNKFSFKTPTVRNAAETAPYMHNGRYETLETVLAFYNAGGGAGMGLKIPGQTLSADSLHLNRKEMQDIIAFIYSLNDKPGELKK